MAVAVMSQRDSLRKHAPLTPPMSSTFEHRRPSPDVVLPGPSRVALPPIAYLDRTLSSMQPLTPPDDGEYANAPPTRLPPILPGYHHQSSPIDDPFTTSTSSKQQQHQLYEIPPPPQYHTRLAPMHHQPTPPVCVWDSAPHLIDWLDFTRNRSAHFIAEKTCEMICYLWFASSPVTRRPTPTIAASSRKKEEMEQAVIVMQVTAGDASTSYPSPHHSPASPSRVASVITGEPSSMLSAPTPSSKSMASSPTRSPPSTLQLVATPSFISFMQKLLETTQVSQSVIVLSLHYIYRLKERNQFTPAQRGSEFRIAVAGLMMANKFLDDNTYTNKTWSEVSGIELEEINRMEREFLLGVDFNLYVDKPTYESWLNLLKGLVSAKERDSMSSSTSRNSRDLGSRRRDARKVSAATTRYHHHHQQQQKASRVPQAYQPPAVQPQTQQQPTATYPAPTSTQSNPTASYATPTRLPPLSRAVPTAYYYPYTSSNAQYASSSTTAVPSQPPYSTSQSSSTFTTQHTYGRARSTSPTPVGYSDIHMGERDDVPSSSSSVLPPPPSAPAAALYSQNQANAHAHATNKRTAEAAFSPTSASFAHLPSKRPLSMVLTIPENGATGSFSGRATTGGGSMSAGGYENSPLDSLSSFSRMSLVEGSPEKRQQQREREREQQQRYQPQPQHVSTQPQQQQLIPSTLVAPYSYQVDTRRRGSEPQDLYFYTLASSPMEAPVPSRSRAGTLPQRKRGMSDVQAQSPTDARDCDHVMAPVNHNAVVEAEDDDDIVETDGHEWERRERERDAHGERRRTRKAKLMRWSTSSSSASGAASGIGAGVGVASGSAGYAYDYSREWSAYRQHQQQQQQQQQQRPSQQEQQPAATTTNSGSYVNSPPAPTASSGAWYNHHAQPSFAPSHHHHSTNAAPAPRAYVPVVQSASTSPMSGVVYVQKAGEVGCAAYGGYPQEQQQMQQQQYHQQSSYPTTTSSTQQYEYASTRESAHQSQAQPPQQQQQQRPATRSQTQPWYTQNQGGSVSYHPSPVQAKAQYTQTRGNAAVIPPYRSSADQGPGTATAYAAHPAHAHQPVTLPHFHDNVWTRPPAVLQQQQVAERGREQRGGEYAHAHAPTVVGGHEHTGGGISPRSRSTSTTSGRGSDADVDVDYEDGDEDEHAIPSAPFANAGPAGVHVPFGSEYARYQGYHHQQQQQNGYSTIGYQQSQPQHHQHQQPQQRDVYTALGQYPPAGSVFTPAYHASNPTLVTKGGQPSYGDEY